MRKREYKMKKTNDFGRDSIPLLVLKISVPFMFAQLVNVLYSIVDRIYVGNIPVTGADALAGVGVCAPIVTLLSSFGTLFGIGGSVLFSVRMGAGDEKNARKILANSFSYLIVVSLALTLIFLLTKEQLLNWFGASDVTFPYADTYMTIYTAGTFFALLSTGMNYFITTQGFAKTAMVTTMLGAGLNVILDPIFMFTFQMGIAGAALATVLSQMVSCLFVLWFLLGKRTQIRLRVKAMRLKKAVFQKILVLGASPFFMSTSEGVMQICFNTQMLKFGGDLAVSALTILFSMFQFINLPLTGIAQGSQPIVSFNYGAKDYGRVRQTLRYALAACTAFSLCGTILMLLFPSFFIRLFNTDPELVELGSRMLRVYIAGCFFIGANTLYQQTYTSLGEGKASFFFAFFRKVILLIPLLYILPTIFPWGVFAVAMAEPVSDLVTTLCNRIYFTRFMKKNLS